MQLVFTFLQWHFESRQTDRPKTLPCTSFFLHTFLQAITIPDSDRSDAPVLPDRFIYSFFFLPTLTQTKSTHWTKLAACIYLWWTEFCKSIIIRKIREWRCLPPALVTTPTVTNNDHVSTNMLIVSRCCKYWSKSTLLLYLSRLFRYFRSFSVLFLAALYFHSLHFYTSICTE